MPVPDHHQAIGPSVPVTRRATPTAAWLAVAVVVALVLVLCAAGITAVYLAGRSG